MKTSRIEFSFEEHEIWRIDNREGSGSLSCTECRDDSPMITAEKLEEAICAIPRNIYNRLENGDVHFVETEKLQVLVCLASFSKLKVDKNEKGILVKS